jgi:hypothetical protein
LNRQEFPKVQKIYKFDSNFFKEPIGSVAPKVNSGERFKVNEENMGKTLSLLCPAQSYPQAIFRYDKKLKFLWFF